MTSVKLMLNKDRILKCGKYPLVFQVIHERKKKLIYTDIKLFEREFNPGKGKICHFKGSELTYHKISLYNQQIKETQEDIWQLVNQLKTRRQLFTVDDIIGSYRNVKCNNDLISYMEVQIQKKKDKKKEGIAAAYKSTMNSLKKFIGNKKVQFMEINFLFLEDYIQYLEETGDSNNTIAFYYRNFRTIYNRAKKEGFKVVSVDPFTEISIKTDKTLKRSLSKDEIRKIAVVDLSDNPKYDLARDLFMFSYFTRGMPFVDIVNLKKTDIINDVIIYRRIKTNQLMQVCITKAIMALIKKYDNPGEYIFPILDPTKKSTLYNQYRNASGEINKKLKIVGKRAGIKTNLTIYVARHSWATNAKGIGTPVSYISDGLGHSSEQMTMIYLRELSPHELHVINEKVTKL
ncbi:tyrosine-type recombinase/integrase [Bacteroides thetaiotaomicron]|uniref:tyrosine-type recombinase/integrase n=1 Tax=Bacteroides thetaiotaomicron TaxID=818 RepID=UPI0039C1FB75